MRETHFQRFAKQQTCVKPWVSSDSFQFVLGFVCSLASRDYPIHLPDRSASKLRNWMPSTGGRFPVARRPLPFSSSPRPLYFVGLSTVTILPNVKTGHRDMDRQRRPPSLTRSPHDKRHSRSVLEVDSSTGVFFIT